MTGSGKPTLVTIAPGIYIDPLMRREIDITQQYILLDAAGLRSLGLSSSQEKLIRRLEYAGCITIFRIAPRRRLLSLQSWNAHIDAVAGDPDFWDKPENKRRWRIACLAI
jgi:hypothetical protein